MSSRTAFCEIVLGLCVGFYDKLNDDGDDDGGSDVVVQVVENAPDLSRVSPAEVKKYVDNQIRRQTRVITFLIRLVDRLMIFLYISIIYRSAERFHEFHLEV